MRKRNHFFIDYSDGQAIQFINGIGRWCYAPSDIDREHSATSSIELSFFKDNEVNKKRWKKVSRKAFADHLNSEKVT